MGAWRTKFRTKRPEDRPTVLSNTCLDPLSHRTTRSFILFHLFLFQVCCVLFLYAENMTQDGRLRRPPASPPHRCFRCGDNLFDDISGRSRGRSRDDDDSPERKLLRGRRLLPGDSEQRRVFRSSVTYLYGEFPRQSRDKLRKLLRKKLDGNAVSLVSLF